MALYFLRIDGDPPDAPIKIGHAGVPAVRLTSLQSSHYRDLVFIRVVEGTLADEKRIHQRFQALRVRGEWFRYDPTMMGPLGLADLPCPAPPAATLRGAPMMEQHRQAISAGLKAYRARSENSS